MYTFKIDNQFNISEAITQLNNLPNLVSARKEKARIYAALLNKNTYTCRLRTQSAPWLFMFSPARYTG